MQLFRSSLVKFLTITVLAINVVPVNIGFSADFSVNDYDIVPFELPTLLSKTATTTYNYNEGLINIHFLGKTNTVFKFAYFPTKDVSEFEYLKLNLTVKNVKGKVWDKPFSILFRDSRLQYGASPKVVLPISKSSLNVTAEGDNFVFYIPMSDFNNGVFDPSDFKNIIFYFQGKGVISSNFVINEFSFLRKKPVAEPTAESVCLPIDPSLIKVLSIPASSQIIKSSTVTVKTSETYPSEVLDSNSVSIDLVGWGNPEVRFRYDDMLDISKYKYLKLYGKFYELTGSLSPEPISLQFYDSTWEGRSNVLYIPETNLNTPEDTVVVFDVSSFFKEGFSASGVKDLVFMLHNSGTQQIGAKLDIKKIVLSNNLNENCLDESSEGKGSDSNNPLPALTPGEGKVSLITENILEVQLDGNVDLTTVLNTSNWKLSSNDDLNFISGVYPVTISRFSATLNADSGVVLRNTFYLKFSQNLNDSKTYSLDLLGNSGIPYSYDGVNGNFLKDYRFGPWQITTGKDSGISKAIKINQFGYSDISTKRYAYVGYWLGDGGTLDFPDSMNFSVYNAESSQLVLSGTTTKRGLDTASGEEVHQIDLSSLSDGRYYIEVAEVGRSNVFRIGGSAYEAYYTAVRGLFHQRAGVALSSEYTPWAHAMCHETVYKVDVLEDWGLKFPSTTSKENPITLSGGWYDAGDFDRRPLHLDVVQHLLILADIFPERISDNALNIPESGNGISDVIDEAMFGLKLWEQLQNEDGGVRSGVEATAHPGTTSCEGDNLTYWTYSANRWTSYKFAAAAAHAARVFDRLGNSERAAQLRNKAVLAWDWAEAQMEIGTTGPGSNGSFHDSNQSDLDRERLWASGELYALTSDDKYQQIFKNLWATLGNPTHFDTFYSVWGMANASWENLDNDLQQQVKNKIFASANEFMNFTEGNEYRNSHNPAHATSVGWGSATNAVKTTVPMIMAYKFQTDPAIKQKYIDAVSLNADYQLGAHPSGRSWITGMGYSTPEFPLHLNSMYDNINQPVPGLPINGAFSSSSCSAGSTYWMCFVFNNFYPAFSNMPALQKYAPWARMAPMNEFAIWTDMSYTSLAYGFLYAVSSEQPKVMTNLRSGNYPLNAGY